MMTGIVSRSPLGVAVNLEQGGSTVATAWQTLEEAALTLGISSRTLHRRLARNEFQTRLENGRREVLVVIPDPTPFPELKLTPDTPAHAAPAPAPAPVASHASVRQPVYAEPSPEPSFEASAAASDESGERGAVEAEEASDTSDDVGHAMLTLHEDRIRRTDLAIMAYQQSVNVTAADARRAHFRTRLAWSVTGGLVVIAFAAGMWGTHTVTRAKGEVSHLGQVVRQLADTVKDRSAEVEHLRHEAETARITAARMEGQLDAAKVQIEQLREAAIARAAAEQAEEQSAERASATAQPASATTRPMAAATTQPGRGLTDTLQRVTLE